MIMLVLILLMLHIYTPGVPARLASVSQAQSLDTVDAKVSDYLLLNEAVNTSDLDELKSLFDRSEGNLRYLVARHLAQQETLNDASRMAFYEVASDLHIRDAHDQREERLLLQGLAETAESSGEVATAIEAYSELLPSAAAIEGLKRLISDPIALSQTLIDKRLYNEGVEALEGSKVPSLEARALRRAGRYEEALASYEQWLEVEPDNLTAALGKAWTLYYLEADDIAEPIFQSQSGDTAFYGQALIKLRQGDKLSAATLLSQSADPYHLWMASEIFEELGEIQKAVDVYGVISSQDSTYADDAAYRSRILSTRFSLPVDDQLPKNDSFNEFFRDKLGYPVEVPSVTELGNGNAVNSLELANALVEVGLKEYAIGELIFALKAAEDEATGVSIAEKLQSLGEYRQSQTAGEIYLYGGSRDLRTWKVAFPRAYEDLVVEAARREGISPSLIWAVMWKESRFSPYATSYTGAKGLMQFVGPSWDWIAEIRGETAADPYDIDSSIKYGATYLKWLSDYFDGDLEMAIPSYNGGQGYILRTFESESVGEDKDNFYRFIDRLEPREYLQTVMHTLKVYEALYSPM